MTLLARQIGRYHVMDRIAYGGMAEIFRAVTFDPEGSERIVAIKKVLPHFSEDRDFIRMLIDEAKLAGMLRHPNIAEVYEFAQVPEGYFIAMEYVDGKDLRSTMEKCRAEGIDFAFDDGAYVMARALEGLHHAHTACDKAGSPLRLVHRDFSPSNILVSYDGHVKICDFGIAKATLNRVQTKTGVIKGKVKYMSPEQALGRRLDHRSDLFSAGSVLYEICTGQAPFTAPNEIDLIFQVRDAVAPAPRDLNRAVPRALEKVIERAMLRSRSSRYQSAQEFRDALVEFIQRESHGYRRSKLARFMRRAWAAEIEEELRILEDYVIGSDVSSSLGQNLIADVLGPDAPFSRFTPMPTMLRQAKPRPATATVHEQATHLFDGRKIEPQSEEADDEVTTGERQGAPPRPASVGASPVDREKTTVAPGRRASSVPPPPHPPSDGDGPGAQPPRIVLPDLDDDDTRTTRYDRRNEG
ncbi:MAG: serine/threonine protein kinase [Deltaproteobacteria bacterium]|nr:serine/threonine protein kinase [Deltaproteobacteria bacterium]